MILEFRTKGNKPRYLGFDTKMNVYSTWARPGTTLDLPQLSVNDYKNLISKFINNGYHCIGFIH